MRLVTIIVFLLVVNTVYCQNLIFKEGRKVTYSVVYESDSIVIKDTLDIIATGKRWKVDPAKQLEIIINYHHAFSDTSIRSQFKSIGWVNTDTTGAVEDSVSCWFHPPRHNYFRMLELAPFPRVNYPLEKDRAYAMMLTIGDGWDELSDQQIMWVYKIQGQQNGIWNIESKAIPQNDKEKVSQLNFSFSETLGFLAMEYVLYNGVKISFKSIL